MKSFFISIAAVFILTAVLLVTIWSTPKKEEEKDSSVYLSSEDSVNSICSVADEDFPQEEAKIGALFLPYTHIVKGGVYKLVTIKQKRFGGNSVPVKTTTYYGVDFINVIEEEGHGIANETFINADGVYCFDSSSDKVYFLPGLEVDTDKIVTENISYIETGEATVGLASFTYERYRTAKGDIIDYLFAGEELKKMKLYNGEDYELISLELYSDISGARDCAPDIEK